MSSGEKDVDISGKPFIILSTTEGKGTDRAEGEVGL